MKVFIITFGPNPRVVAKFQTDRFRTFRENRREKKINKPTRGKPYARRCYATLRGLGRRQKSNCPTHRCSGRLVVLTSKRPCWQIKLIWFEVNYSVFLVLMCLSSMLNTKWPIYFWAIFRHCITIIITPTKLYKIKYTRLHSLRLE